jgi:paraquat-inducible protein B
VRANRFLVHRVTSEHKKSAPFRERFLGKLMDQLEEIPFQEIGKDVHTIVRNVDKATEQINILMQKINTEVEPEFTATLEQTKKTLVAMENILSSDSPLNQETRRALKEVGDAAGVIRILMDYLERHPDALIFGKGDNQ